MIVVKFGGASLAAVDRMRAAARIVAGHGRRDQMVVCVVSAMAGVTDALIRIGECAAQGRPGWRETTIAIRARLLDDITALTATATTATTAELPVRFEAAWQALEADLAWLVDAGSTLAPDERTAATARFSAWGERFSTLLMTLALRAEGCDAVAFEGEPVVASLTDGAAGGLWSRYAPSLAATRAAITPQVAAARGAALVAPGYIARGEDGALITLGRNGSDYSAALIGAALRADAVYIYSDVAGIHRADPRIAPDADVLPALTYADAAALANHGARVLHPATLRPLAELGIPLYLRSALAPDAPGTLIGPARQAPDHAAQAPDWAITARPAIGDDPLVGLRERLPGEDESVIVTCALLAHRDTLSGEDARRFQLSVPAGKAAAIQRQLLGALRYLEQRSALVGLLEMAPALPMLEAR